MKNIYLFLFLFLFGNINAQDLHTRHKDLPCLNKHYNVFAHAVYDSLRTTHTMAGLEGAIATANKYFAPICISFSLCEMDTVFNYQYNTLTGTELEEISTLYEGKNRINLYLIQDTLVRPGVAGLCKGSVSGGGDIYLKSLGSLTHELGHYFGLLHTFVGDTLTVDSPITGDTLNYELVNGSNCLDFADGICDTPADPFVTGEPLDKYIKDCVFIFTERDANGEYFQPDVGNIMSYYGCDCGFTYGQYQRMALNYLNAAKKHW